jgi:hypothetical protein
MSSVQPTDCTVQHDNGKKTAAYPDVNGNQVQDNGQGIPHIIFCG